MTMLTDFLPIEKWIDFEKEISRRFGLNAAVFDPDGVRITNYVKWANELCPVIKGNKDGQTYICSAAHQQMAALAKKTKKGVVQECDAGLVKIVFPVFIDGEFLGVVGGCGQLPAGEEVESFLISKITNIDEEKIINFSSEISVMESEQQEKIVQYLENQIARIVNGFYQNVRECVNG